MMAGLPDTATRFNRALEKTSLDKTSERIHAVPTFKL